MCQFVQGYEGAFLKPISSKPGKPPQVSKERDGGKGIENGGEREMDGGVCVCEREREQKR